VTTSASDASAPDGGLQQGPLHDRHVALGAKLADFGGWHMPIEYPGGGVLKEHLAVREAVGVFDVSHLGKGVVRSAPGAAARGAGAVDFVNDRLTNDLRRVGTGQAQYTLCCDEASGGVVDDLIAYVRSEDEVFLIPNAANSSQVVGRLQADAPAGIEVEDLHRTLAVIAVQGPRSRELVQALGTAHRPRLHVLRGGAVAGPVGRRLPHRLHRRARLRAAAGLGRRGRGLGRPARARRGPRCAPVRPRRRGHAAHRDGLPAARAGPVARDHPGAGAGHLGRRLVASRGSGDATPGAREGAGAARLLWGLQALDRGIPRAHMGVLRDGAPVGEVTSGTFSPTRRVGIGLALLDRSVTEGDEVTVDVRGRTSTMLVVRPPFVPSRVR
jgi:aminomethyltransferase